MILMTNRKTRAYRKAQKLLTHGLLRSLIPVTTVPSLSGQGEKDG